MWEFPSNTGYSRCGFTFLFACSGRGLFFVLRVVRRLSLKYMRLFQGRCSELKYRHCFKEDILF